MAGPEEQDAAMEDLGTQPEIAAHDIVILENESAPSVAGSLPAVVVPQVWTEADPEVTFTPHEIPQGPSGNDDDEQNLAQGPLLQ